MINVIIPMAGEGKRFKDAGYTLPKPLLDVGGKPMIVRALESLNIEGKYHFVVRNNEYITDTIFAIETVKPKSDFHLIQNTTQGAAASCLKFENKIDPEEELVIVNCDQIMNWNSENALQSLSRYDGGVVTIRSNDPKHSYVKMEGDVATTFKEKEVISDNALTGIHYWKKAKYFFTSANKMIMLNEKSANGEFYIAPTYNHLIQEGLDIGSYMINDDEINFVGTPEDLRIYNESR
jgi:NDP-sugar pyrophosphorylase family protein